MNALEGIKVGNPIFVGRSNYDKRLATVAKVGKLHITSSEGIKYSIQTGRRAGKSPSVWSGSWATIATPEEIAQHKEEYRKRHLCRLIAESDWKSQTLETLEAVVALIK